MNTAVTARERLSFKPSEVAELLGVPKSSIYSAISRGHLRAQKIGIRSMVVTRSAIVEYVGEDVFAS